MVDPHSYPIEENQMLTKKKNLKYIDHCLKKSTSLWMFIFQISLIVMILKRQMRERKIKKAEAASANADETDSDESDDLNATDNGTDSEDSD